MQEREMKSTVFNVHQTFSEDVEHALNKYVRM